MSTETADCGHTYETPQSAGPSGYARLVEGRTLANGSQIPANGTVCYSCSNELERADMASAETFFAYLNEDGRKVTSWPGGELGTVVGPIGRSHGVTPSGGEYETVYVRVVDFQGRKWSGRGPGEGCYLRLRRTKEHADHGRANLLSATLLAIVAAVLLSIMAPLVTGAAGMLGQAKADQAPCTEDMDCWDCHTMGNGICGTVTS